MDCLVLYEEGRPLGCKNIDVCDPVSYLGSGACRGQHDPPIVQTKLEFMSPLLERQVVHHTPLGVFVPCIVPQRKNRVTKKIEGGNAISKRQRRWNEEFRGRRNSASKRIHCEFGERFLAGKVESRRLSEPLGQLSIRPDGYSVRVYAAVLDLTQVVDATLCLRR